MTKILIIIMLFWSLICTLWILYKDWSGYGLSLDEYDFIFAGPVAWVLVLFLIMFRLVIQKLADKKKKSEYKPKSQRYVQRVVRKIVNIYKIYHGSKWKEIFNFTWHSSSVYGDVNGWSSLVIHKPRYAFINKRFERLMFFQRGDTIQELAKYFDVMTEKEKREYIEDWYGYQDVTLYWLKEEDEGIDKG